MRTGTVIALHVGGRGNKIFNYGDMVNENNFPEGNFQQCVERGFLLEITETEKRTEHVAELAEDLDEKSAENKHEVESIEEESVRGYKKKK